MTTVPAATANQAVARYYRLHNKIYDVTRWSFLFGRRALLQQIQTQLTPIEVLEVGCGTGQNLQRLAVLFPHARLTGLDLSAEMLAHAQRKVQRSRDRVQLVQQSYDQPLRPTRPFDLILFAYSLSMFNPGWEQAIEHAWADLRPGGMIAVLDFHESPLALFRQWMKLNHVRMTGHLLPYLATHFHCRSAEVRSAYGGLWTFLLFIGMKSNHALD